MGGGDCQSPGHPVVSLEKFLRHLESFLVGSKNQACGSRWASWHQAGLPTLCVQYVPGQIHNFGLLVYFMFTGMTGTLLWRTETPWTSEGKHGLAWSFRGDHWHCSELFSILSLHSNTHFSKPLSSQQGPGSTKLRADLTQG